MWCRIAATSGCSGTRPTGRRPCKPCHDAQDRARGPLGLTRERPPGGGHLFTRKACGDRAGRRAFMPAKFPRGVSGRCAAESAEFLTRRSTSNSSPLCEVSEDGRSCDRLAAAGRADPLCPQPAHPLRCPGGADRGEHPGVRLDQPGAGRRRERHHRRARPGAGRQEARSGAGAGDRARAHERGAEAGVRACGQPAGA